MNDFASSYVGQLRKIIGNRLLLAPGARIVIQDDRQRVLLQKRSDFNIWGLPGGNAEEGEDILSIIVREVEEETSLRVLDAKPFGFGSSPSLETCIYPNGDRAQHFVLNFFSRRFEGTAKVADDESLDMQWFPIDQLPDDILPNMLESIKAYQRFLASGEFQLF
ncbi:MAG: NUDIX hydrolase [Hyphomicrobiales bacterium]|nr:MAG: NUDIX hydrolase [Hyphomicrobiales bacterium]